MHLHPPPALRPPLKDSSRSASPRRPAPVGRARHALLALLALAVLAWAGDGVSWGAPARPAPDTAGQKFDAQVDDYIDYRYRVSPTLGTRQGAIVFDDRLEDVSDVGIMNHIEALRLMAQDMKKVDLGRLGPEQRIDHDLLVADLEASLWEAAGARRWMRDPGACGRLAVGCLAPLLTKPAPGDEARRLRVILARMRLIPVMLERGRQTLEPPSALLAGAALREHAAVSAFFTRDLPAAVAPVRDKRFLYEFREAQGELVAAVAAWGRFLEALPAGARGDYRVGVDVMRSRLRLEDPDLTVDRFVRQASDDLAQAREAVKRLAPQVRPGGTVAEALAEARKATLAPGDIAPRIQGWARDAAAFARGGLCDVPDPFPVGLGIAPALLLAPESWGVEVPGPFAVGPAGIVLRRAIGAGEGGAAGPTTAGEASVPGVETELAVLSEVVPGRGLRLLAARQAPTRLRRVLLDASALEGWGPYATGLALEGGFDGSNAALRLVAARAEARAHAMALVAVQLHARRMDEGAALGFLREQAFLGDEEARAALVEVARNPGVVAASLGVHGMRALRPAVEKARGLKLSPRAIHEAVLRQGIVPLRILRRILEGRYSKR